MQIYSVDILYYTPCDTPTSWIGRIAARDRTQAIELAKSVLKRERNPASIVRISAATV